MLPLPILLATAAAWPALGATPTPSPAPALPTGLAINEPCQHNSQCNGTKGAQCSPQGRCACPYKEVVSEALGFPRCFHPVRTLYDSCEVDEQCQRAILNSHCSSAGLCTCHHGYMYFWSSGTCALPPGPDLSRAQEVYKTAMAAAACTLIALVAIFLACVLKKTFCSTAPAPGLSSRPSHPHRMTSVAESVASLSLVDKPPSYDEIMASMTCVTPPPDYRDLRMLFGLPLTPTGAPGAEFFPLGAPPYFSVPQPEVASRSTQVDHPAPSSSTHQTSLCITPLGHALASTASLDSSLTAGSAPSRSADQNSLCITPLDHSPSIPASLDSSLTTGPSPSSSTHTHAPPSCSAPVASSSPHDPALIDPTSSGPAQQKVLSQTFPQVSGSAPLDQPGTSSTV